jgi:hypothetical protein
VDRFIKGVIAYVRSPAVDLESLVSVASSSTDESISLDFFPFTNHAVDALKSLLTIVVPNGRYCRIWG